MNTKNNNKYAVPALDKGFDILEFLAQTATPLSQTEIAQGIDRSANEIYRVLVGLEARGYLTRNEVSGKYSLSLKLFNLSRKVSPFDQLRQVAIPIMEDFSAQSGFASYLSVLYQSKVMVIVHARSYAPLSLSVAEGTLFSTVDTTPGKVLLANSNDDVKKLIYDRNESFQKMTSTEKKQLTEDLHTIVEQNYHYSPNPLTSGVIDCATLVGEPQTAITAVLTVSSLASAIKNKPDQENLIALLKTTAQKINQQLGC